MTEASTVAKAKTDNRVQYLLTEIAAARKREKDWRGEGKRILDIYNGKRKDSIPFNILYSNTETLSPALYSQQPRPVVQRRFKDEDPIGKAASMAGQRTLEFMVDTNSEEYADFDDVMIDAVTDALLPGRGATRIRYDADIVGEGSSRYVKDELVCFESLKWDRWVHGYARKWRKVPWVAFEHDVTVEEATRLFGAAKANKLKFVDVDKAVSDREDDANESQDKTDEDRKIAKVWEVWIREGKKIKFVSPNYQDDFLKEDDDSLGLTGFFPMPKPLQFLRKSNDLSPTPLYSLYENQAKELNRVTMRINRVVEAVKVRGAYDSNITELDDLLKKDDNVMVAAQNVAALQEGGLEKAIWLMPLDKLIVVLQQLYVAREQCKRVIYEITGISDLLRGSTVASETATAQNLKNQWGTLRLKRLQRDVQRYCRETLRISLEIAAKRFSERTFAGMTALPYATEPEVQAAQGQIAAARSQLAMTQPQVMANPQALAQAMQQMVPMATQTMQKPQWKQVLATLKDNTQRQYRIDIETNSTVDVEATEDQKQMSEVLQAVSQFIQGVSPLVINGSMPFQVAQSMLLSIVRRYRMGSEIEDYIKEMKAPVSPDQGKQQAEQAKAAAEQQKQAFELKKSQDEHGLKMQEAQAKAALDQQSMQLEAQLKREELEFKREELRLKKELLVAQTEAKMAQLRAQVAAAHAMPKKENNHAPA